MAKIAIVGVEGSGKTVFVTCLAKYLDTHRQLGMFLDPQNLATQQYVDRVWEQLQSGENATFTDPQSLPELSWKVRLDVEPRKADHPAAPILLKARERFLPPCRAADLRVIDPAGHSVRELFKESHELSGARHERLDKLAQHLADADIVLVLVDLKDYLGVSKQSDANANQLVLKFAMDFLRSAGAKRRQCAVVFSKCDLYENVRQQEGSWANVARKYTPLLFATHLTGQQTPVFGVSSINRTRVVHAQGQSFRAPAAGFQTEGLEAVVHWLKAALARVHDTAQLAQLKQVAMTELGNVGRFLRSSSKWIIAALIFFAVVPPLLKKMGERPPSPPKPRPVAVKAVWKLEQMRWWYNRPPDDFDVLLSVEVRNDGAPGSITIFGRAYEKGATYTAKVTENFFGGETKTVVIRIDTGPTGTGKMDAVPTYDVVAGG